MKSKTNVICDRCDEPFKKERELLMHRRVCKRDKIVIEEDEVSSIDIINQTLKLQ